MMLSSSESEEETIVVRKRPVFRERVNWNFLVSNSVFKENFRCTPEKAELLLQIIGSDIEPKCYRNHALSPKEKLLISLRFFGDNDDYHAIGAAERIPIFVSLLHYCIFLFRCIKGYSF